MPEYLVMGLGPFGLMRGDKQEHDDAHGFLSVVAAVAKAENGRG